MMSYHIPESLVDIEGFIADSSVDSAKHGIKNLKVHLEKFYYLIDYLYCYRFIIKTNRLKRHGLLPLDSQRLKKVMGDRYYKGILNILIDAGVIDYDASYSTYLHISKHARLKPKFLKDSPHTGEYKARKVLRSIEDYRKSRNGVDNELLEWVNQQMNKLSFTTDVNFYINYRRNKAIENKTTKDNTICSADLGKVIKKKKKKKTKEYDQDKYETDQFIIKCADRKDWRITRDNLTKRIYSTFTCMSKKLRWFIRFDGEPLHSIDIQNSQPLLLALLLREDNIVSALPEFNEFLEDCLNGDIYSLLAGKEDGDITREERKLAKDEAYKYIFFGPDYKYINSKPLERFKSLYPEVYQYYRFLKADGLYNSNNPEVIEIMRLKNYHYNKSYAIAPVLLQRLEASIMIDYVLKRCHNEGIPAIPLHDAIYTTADFTHKIEGMVLDAFWEAFKIKPMLKTT